MHTILYTILLGMFTGAVCSAQQVQIHGRWEDGPKSVWLNYLEDATTAKHSTLNSRIDSTNHTFDFYFELSYPTIIYIADEPFIVLPGDEVNVNVLLVNGESKLNFEDSRKLEHNFLISLRHQLGPFPFFNNLGSGSAVEGYSTAIKNHFDSALLFVKDYFPPGSQFVNIAKDFVRIQYYAALIYPLYAKTVTLEKLPSTYFGSVDFSLFKKESLLGLREFIMLVSYYNAYFYSSASPDRHYYDSLNMDAKIWSAKLNFEGTIQDHLLLFLFTNLIENGTVHSKSQVSQLYEHLIKTFAADPSVVVQLQELKSNFDMVGKPLPREILDQKMTSKEGQEVILGEVISPNAVIYIDFWASWCVPCIQEMPFEKQLISELKGARVKFILISLDENETKWRNAMTRINVDCEHYHIPEGFKSNLVKHLSFNSIPQYIIIGKDGKLTSRDAPRPGYILKNKSVLLNLAN